MTRPEDPGDTDAAVQLSTTGVPGVDAALERLQDVSVAPVDEHVAIYDDVHRRLQDALTDLDGS